MDKWSCYIIENRGYTYVGVSNNVHKRLRAHNKEISGGAKYTTSKGKGWRHICVVHGFPTKIESLQVYLGDELVTVFEYRLTA